MNLQHKGMEHRRTRKGSQVRGYKYEFDLRPFHGSGGSVNCSYSNVPVKARMSVCCGRALNLLDRGCERGDPIPASTSSGVLVGGASCQLISRSLGAVDADLEELP